MRSEVKIWAEFMQANKTALQLKVAALFQKSCSVNESDCYRLVVF